LKRIEVSSLFCRVYIQEQHHVCTTAALLG
jgi:hypothetical protein